jgi:KDO2-lipid IV(A) lauroyltransferase
MRNLLGYGLLRLAVGLVGLLPAALTRACGTLGGLGWYVLAGKRRAMGRRHMARVLGPNADLDRATKDMFRWYGRYWAETFWVRPRRVSQIDRHLEIVGLEHLEKAAAARTGVVIALPHLGNWEPAGLSGKRAGIEIVAVAERLPNQRLTEWFTRVRAQLGITIVLNGRGSMRAIESAVARGAAVALVCDRDLTGRGVRVRFFGEETTLPAGPAALVLRTGVPLILASTYFTPEGHRLILEELPLPPPDQRDLTTITQMLAEGLERVVLGAPEQWHLLQPNWPSDPGYRGVAVDSLSG